MSTEDQNQNKPSGFLSFLRALFFFVLFALGAVIWVRFSGPVERVEDARAKARIEKRVALEKQDAEKLANLAEAKKVVIGELKDKKVAASTVKVDAPLPPVPPADPNATEPPPAALPSSPQGADTIRFDLPAPAPTSLTEIKK